MSDLYHDGTAATGEAARRPWYRRRASQVAIAGTAAAGLVVAGLAMGTTATADVAPADAVAEAAENLRQLPTGVTITGTDEMPGEVTIVRTDDGVQISLLAPEQDASVGMALVADRLFLRVSSSELAGFTSNPLAVGAAAAFPSLAALLDGKWVSLDVSPDSALLAELQELGASQLADPDAFEAAATELQAAMEAVAEDARGTMQAALQDNVTVTEPDQQKTGPANSTHYEVVVDKQAIVEELEPTMRQALTDVLAAVDAFVAETGAELPDGGAMWDQARTKILAKFDEALAEGSSAAPGTIDVWVVDEELAKIAVDGATLTFDPDASLSAPDVAVSMDEDLLALLPLLEQTGIPALPLG
jgi:hypothetical protein